MKKHKSQATSLSELFSIPRTISNLELILSSGAVAIVCGLLGKSLSNKVEGNILTSSLFSFAISWLVCKYLFPSAHEVGHHTDHIGHKYYYAVALITSAFY